MDTYTIQEIVDMAKCPIDKSKKLVFVEQARKELKKELCICNIDILLIDDKCRNCRSIDEVLNES